MKSLSALRRLLPLAIFLAVGQTAGMALAQETRVPDKPELTVRITPPKPYLQEQIVQVVRVVAAHPFEELVLDLPAPEGAETITLQQPKNRKFQTYGGEGYIFETSRAIFPIKSGTLQLPPVRISGSVGISRDEREAFVLRQDAMTMEVKPPPDAFSEDWWLVARRVEIEESWSQPIETLRVGDRVTHTVEATAAGVTGAHLPELEHGRSTGLTIIPGLTERETEITQNGVIGKIRRSFDLRVDVDQPINVSPVRVVWWNTDNEIEWRSAAPSVRIEPLPRDVDALVTTLMAEAESTQVTSRYGIIALVILGLIGMAALAARFLLIRRSVTSADRMLMQAVREQNRPIEVVRALIAWANRSFPDQQPMSLDRLGRLLGGEAEGLLMPLQKAAFGIEAGKFDPSGMAARIVDVAQKKRRRRLASLPQAIARHILGSQRHLPTIDRRL